MPLYRAKRLADTDSRQKQSDALLFGTPQQVDVWLVLFESYGKNPVGLDDHRLGGDHELRGPGLPPNIVSSFDG